MSTGRRLLDAAAGLGRPRTYLVVAAILVGSQLPYFVPTSLVHMLVLTFIVGTAAVAWNVIGGFGGQFSLGNATFFGIAGYTMGVMMVRFETGFVVAAGTAVVLSLLAAVVVGYPSFKLSGHYFALATITIVEGLRFLTRFFQDVTGGAQGMSLIPATVRDVAALNLTKTGYYQAALVLFVCAVLASLWTRRTKLGFYLMAIRDDQLAAASLGIDVSRYKMYGWLLSAGLTALAGVMYTTYIQFLDPSFMFSITQSVLFAVIPIIGGVGTVAGPVVGTFLLYPIQHFALTELGGRLGAITYVGYGILLILLIVYAPEGVTPKLRGLGGAIESKLPTFTVENEESETDRSA